MRIIISLRWNGVIGVTFPKDQKTNEEIEMADVIGYNEICNIENITDYAIKIEHSIILKKLPPNFFYHNLFSSQPWFILYEHQSC
jgi:hypothetical protein